MAESDCQVGRVLYTHYYSCTVDFRQCKSVLVKSSTLYKPAILAAHSKKTNHFPAIVALASAENCPRKTTEKKTKKRAG